MAAQISLNIDPRVLTHDPMQELILRKGLQIKIKLLSVCCSKKFCLHMCKRFPPPILFQSLSIQLSPLTLLVFGQLHRAVDVGGHLPTGEVAPLLVPAVGVISL